MRRRARRPRIPGDAGYSLTEVLVSMGLMSIVMAIASTGFYSMYHLSDAAETAALAQAELQAAFNKLDREVRYAARVSDPYFDSSTWYIDYVFPDDTGVNQCVQLSLPRAGGTLKHRQWDQRLSPSAAATAVANNLISARTDASVPPKMTNPFVLKASGDGGSVMDRLNLKVRSVVGQDETKQGVREYDLEFTALNTLSRAKYPLTCTK